MKVYMFLAIALLFVGLVRSEEEAENLADEDDFRMQLVKGGHGVSTLVIHAVKVKHQYLICHRRYPHIVRRCNHKIRHLTRVYNHLRRSVHKSKRVLRHWLHKYRWCNKFCWWRRGHRKGDEEQQEEE
eukprot:301123_1